MYQQISCILLSFFSFSEFVIKNLCIIYFLHFPHTVSVFSYPTQKIKTEATLYPVAKLDYRMWGTCTKNYTKIQNFACKNIKVWSTHLIKTSMCTHTFQGLILSNAFFIFYHQQCTQYLNGLGLLLITSQNKFYLFFLSTRTSFIQKDNH